VQIIKIKVEIAPSMKEKEGEIQEAFSQEIVRVTEEALAALERSDTVVCMEECPGEGPLVVVHFRERERPGMIRKILAGDMLNGTTALIDGREGEVLREEHVEGKDYSGMVAMINNSIIMKLVKEKEHDQNLPQYVERINQIALVSEVGQKVLTDAR
jgi:hypothetical protein